MKTYIDDGSGKLHDKTPDLGLYDGMMVEKHNVLKENPALQRLLYDIWRLDKTSDYGYGRKAKDTDFFGELPEKPGKRWLTPREIVAQEFRLSNLDIWVYHKQVRDKKLADEGMVKER